jgi:hypothetical protein
MSAASTREELHLRRIDLRGFRRSDGLFEVEARLVDTKPDDYRPIRGRAFIAQGEPVHDLGVRLVFDEDMVVREAITFTNAAPYPACPGGGHAFGALVGLRMDRGWNAAVKERLGGERSCTHLRELLGPVATVAFQSLSVMRGHLPERVDANGRPLKIDSCHAYAAGGELVREYWPAFHEPDPMAG